MTSQPTPSCNPPHPPPLPPPNSFATAVLWMVFKFCWILWLQTLCRAGDKGQQHTPLSTFLTTRATHTHTICRLTGMRCALRCKLMVEWNSMRMLTEKSLWRCRFGRRMCRGRALQPWLIASLTQTHPQTTSKLKTGPSFDSVAVEEMKTLLFRIPVAFDGWIVAFWQLWSHRRSSHTVKQDANFCYLDAKMLEELKRGEVSRCPSSVLKLFEGNSNCLDSCSRKIIAKVNHVEREL